MNVAVHHAVARRRSGVLLHPTSLPGPHGSGDFGPGAYHFMDWLHGAGQSLWQVLPLNPIGPGNSPYAGVSAFGGNPLLVALEPLIEKEWLAAPSAADLDSFNTTATDNRIDYGRTIRWRMAQLRQAWAGFKVSAAADDRRALQTYCATEQAWLDDYALFMALDHAVNGKSGTAFRAWCDWDADLATRQSTALDTARTRYADDIAFWQFTQWCFETQWQALRAYGKARGISVVGDLPIFVAHHSADCWARPDLYWLDGAGHPTVVAGVPPDYFSQTGQRWGNPLYRWDQFETEGFAWWTARVKRQLALADSVRIDHFRGFAAYWEIPAVCATAVDGRWVDAPGEKLFQALQAALGTAYGDASGQLPIIAEDLGVITPDVEALRDSCGFPGMRILQFAFGDTPQNPYLPHNYPPNCVAYTGTHDNDTSRGWWASATPAERETAARYLNIDVQDDAQPIHWTMIRAAIASVANTVIFPLQDVLGLDGAHRMNTPGLMGAWEWRFSWAGIDDQPALRLKSLTRTYGR